jgi:hypothetical protein
MARADLEITVGRTGDIKMNEITSGGRERKMRYEVTLKYKKETRGTVVYENETEGFPGIYVPKEHLPTGRIPTVLYVVFSDQPQAAARTSFDPKDEMKTIGITKDGVLG